MSINSQMLENSRRQLQREKIVSAAVSHDNLTLTNKAINLHCDEFLIRDTDFKSLQVHFKSLLK